VPDPKYVCLDGEIVPWSEATVHVSTVAFKFGAAVFEGVRGYWNAQHEQLYLFRLDAHLRRLLYSQTFMRFDPIADAESVAAKTRELIRANGFREDVFASITAFVNGPGGVTARGPQGLAITVVPQGRAAKAEAGCSAQVSSWQRVSDSAMPLRVKSSANYQNSRMAALQAQADGYDAPILLNARGKVAEGHAMCVFMVRDGVAVTPTITSDVLEGITRSTVLDLLRESGRRTEEREVDRSEFAAAEEAFFCGTFWEITPITSVDRLPVGDGKVGPVVRDLQSRYARVARGEAAAHRQWRTPVYAPAEGGRE
jgi:branched-chain amino acid aminotransferase